MITENGLTDTVKAGDDIDQRETISPLLWRIFYNPLLCKIQDDPKLRYMIKCTWRPDFQSLEEKTIQLRNAAAYL